MFCFWYTNSCLSTRSKIGQLNGLLNLIKWKIYITVCQRIASYQSHTNAKADCLRD